MKVTLFVSKEKGYPYMAWIKDQALADRLQRLARTEWDGMYFERHDYEIVDSNINFDDRFYLSYLQGLDSV